MDPYRCPHEWVEIEHFRTWTSDQTGDDPPKGCTVTVIYECILCGAERTDLIPEGK